MSGAGLGRALRAAGSAARPVPAALRARFSARRWEGPAECRRLGRGQVRGSQPLLRGHSRAARGEGHGRGCASRAAAPRSPSCSGVEPGERSTSSGARLGPERTAAPGPLPGRAEGQRLSRHTAGPGRGRCPRPPLFVTALAAPSGRRCGAGTALRGLSWSGSEASSYNCCSVGSPDRPRQQSLCGRDARASFLCRLPHR